MMGLRSRKKVTGEPRDTETVKHGSEGGRWKSACEQVTRWRPTLPQVRFGERDGENRNEQSLYGVPVPTLRDPEPSEADISTTQQIIQAGKLLDVQTVDHIIIGGGRYVSLRERGLDFE